MCPDRTFEEASFFHFFSHFLVSPDSLGHIVWFYTLLENFLKAKVLYAQVLMQWSTLARDRFWRVNTGVVLVQLI